VVQAELERLRAVAQAALPEFLRDLQRLVDVDSGTYSKAGVDEVGTWMAGRLEALGAAVVRHANADVGDTIVGTLEREGPGPSVLMIGHLDTVFEPGTVAQRPFEIRGGRAHGPGVADMKAGLLVGLHALAALRDVAPGRPPGHAAGSGVGWLPVRRLVFIANPDEEIGSPVSSAVIREEAAQADVALILEPARENGDVVSSRTGRSEVALHMHGQAAHAGVQPEKGRSAILEAAHATIALHGLTGLAPGVTVNVGVIRGGTRPNVVAEHASLDVDVRARSRADLESVEAAIMGIAAEPSVAGVTTTVDVRSRVWPLERTERSARLVRHAVEVAAALGFEIGDATTGGVSDGNTTADVGVPTLDGLGPVGGLAHGPGEYVALGSIAPRTALLAGLLRAIGEDPNQVTRSRGRQRSEP
jgi:glutamate carboxypeptidase